MPNNFSDFIKMKLFLIITTKKSVQTYVIIRVPFSKFLKENIQYFGNKEWKT